MIRLCDAARGDFFKAFIVVDEGEGLCHIKAKGEAEEQVYARKGMDKFINQYCASYFFNLPSSLSQYSERLLRGVDLEKRVVKRMSEDMFIGQSKEVSVRICGKEARREIIELTERIILDLDKEFTIDGFEHRNRRFSI